MTTLIPVRHHPLAAAIALALSGSAGAATITVDGSKCNLVDAIESANQDAAIGRCSKGSGADTLNLTAAVYNLTRVDNDTDGNNALPSVTSVVTINGDPDGDGKGASIQGSYEGHITAFFRLFHIAPNGTLSLNHTALHSRLSTEYVPGGGLYNRGGLRLTRCTLNATGIGAIANNGGRVALTKTRVSSGSRGLVNFNKGTVTLNESTVSDNFDSGFSNGGILGVVSVEGGRVTLIHSTVSGNGKGGFVNYGTVTVTHSTVAGNGDRYGDGGGFRNFGKVTLTDTVLSGNSGWQGGGFFNVGRVSLAHGTVTGNSGSLAGGAFWNSGSVTLTNSTLSNNSATAGGGFYNTSRGSVSVTNSTLSGNSATRSGGGFNNLGSAALNNSTLSGNSAGQYGGGLNNGNSGNLTLTNSIIANSLAGGDCADSGTLKHIGVNLIEDGRCGVAAAGGLNGDPKLGFLVDNGSSTLTHALLAGSKAINRSSTLCPNADQRGVQRPQGNHCDIGAFERVLTAGPEVKAVVDFFDQAASKGHLVGTGSTPGTKLSQREAVRNQLLLAGDLLERRLPKQACPQLKATLQRIDTDQTPDKNDYVTGTSGAVLAEKVKDLRSSGCG